MTKQQIAKILGYTRVRLTTGADGTGTLIQTIWKVPRKDGRKGKGHRRETVDELPDFTPEEIARAERWKQGQYLATMKWTDIRDRKHPRPKGR